MTLCFLNQVSSFYHQNFLRAMNYHCPSFDKYSSISAVVTANFLGYLATHALKSFLILSDQSPCISPEGYLACCNKNLSNSSRRPVNSEAFTRPSTRWAGTKATPYSLAKTTSPGNTVTSPIRIGALMDVGVMSFM